MKIIYPGVEKEVSNPSFIIGNKLGSYLFLQEKPQSRYQGLFFMENFRMFKTIECIELKEPIESVNLGFNAVEMKRGGFIERFFLPQGFNSLIYQLTKEKEIELILDCKESYDNDEFGRQYEIEKVKGKILVRYLKKNPGGVQYRVYLAIKPDKLNHSCIDKWIKREYEYDKKRNSRPFERYVYSALKIRAKDIVFSMSLDEEEALMEADYVFNNRTRLKKKSSFNLKNIVKAQEINLAYNYALNSLDIMTFSNGFKGIFAGFPWFFQLWTRDELISLRALYLNRSGEFVKQVLLGQLNAITLDGLMFDKYPAAGLKNADSSGWLFKRLSEIKLTQKEKGLVKERLEYCLNGILKNHYEQNLIKNSPQGTWMDTEFSGDNRGGFRIEIQAMQLFLYRYMHCLSKDIKYKKMELHLKKQVRAKFWDGCYLRDGLDDATIRPNVFIAYYFYPELLSRREWVTCFKKIIPKIWLEWGGFSTIETTSPLFTSEHTGEDNRSYHRGDSWFWLNNLAAIALSRVSKKEFKEYIYSILGASTYEILLSGAIGCASELSSAKELRSEGCLNQAWSNALYIELVEELF